MPLLPILTYPDSRLRTVAKDVTDFNPALKTLINDMAETMYEAPGIGLAATQVDVHKRLIVIDISEGKSDLRVLINPQITDKDGEAVYEEGCLSVPEIYAEVQRAERIKVKALDSDGQSIEFETDGLLAICIQHEIDHLDGKVFVDYLSRMKQSRIRTKMQKRA